MALIMPSEKWESMMRDPMPTEKTMTLGTWVMLITLSLVWGGSFFFQGVAVKELPTFTIVVARVALAAVALLVILKVLGIGLPNSGRVWAAFFGMGALNNAIPFTLIVWGQSSIASGLASILNATTPLFGVLVAHFLTSDEKLTPRKMTGVILGFAGVALMLGPDLLRDLGGNALAQLAVLGAALSYALAGIFGRRFKALGVPPVAVATGQVAASSALLIPIMLLVDKPWTLLAPGLGTILALIALATVSTAFAYILYFRILENAGATNLLLVTFLIPASAIVLGILFLGEHLLAKHLLGMLVIGLGLAAIDGRLLTMFRGRKAPLST